MFDGNTATYGAAYSFYYSPSSTINNVEVMNNNGSTVIDTDGSNVLIGNSRISNNIGNWAVLWSYGSRVLYENVLIENHDEQSGVLLSISGNYGYGYPDAPVELKNTIIRNNHVTGIDGLIDIYLGKLIINKSEISNNSQAHGVIRYGLNSKLEIINTTIGNNISSRDDVNNVITNLNASHPEYYGEITIINSIIWGNGGHINEPISLPGTLVTGMEVPVAPASINYSLIQGGWPDENSLGILDIDPLFVDPSSGDYRLSDISPAIDAGDPNSPLDPDGTRADLGAYPFNQSQVSELTPLEAIELLIDVVKTFNLQQGIFNSLDAKLDSALIALNDTNEHNDQAAINSLYAFINAVEAQREKKITHDQADELISMANGIIELLL